MDEVIIVGGGFSAFLAKLILGPKASIISTSGNYNFLEIGMKRLKKLETNKIYPKNSRSFGKLDLELKKLRLHDRLNPGGNSNIWGGIVDVEMLNANIISKLKEFGIIFQSLSLNKTGNCSNNRNLVQLLDKNNKIFNFGNFFEAEKDNFLESFFLKNDFIGLNVISLDKNFEKKTIWTKKLVICTGVFQTIDLLHRSGFTNNNSTIALSEFGYKKSVSITSNPNSFNSKENKLIVRFNLLRAACHFLGIQKKLWFSNFFNYLPFFINQNYYDTKTEYLLKIIDDRLIEIESTGISTNTAYGKSIHYSNLMIDQLNVNEFINKISPKISGLGMAFVNQLRPGPISNDIILDAFKKLNDL